MFSFTFLSWLTFHIVFSIVGTCHLQYPISLRIYTFLQLWMNTTRQKHNNSINFSIKLCFIVNKKNKTILNTIFSTSLRRSISPKLFNKLKGFSKLNNILVNNKIQLWSKTQITKCVSTLQATKFIKSKYA